MSDYGTPYDLAADQYANGDYDERDPATDPREITVTRYVCPHCSRGHSKKAAAVAHMPRCWRNPEVRGCKTCVFYEPGDWLTTRSTGPDYDPETCTRGLLDNATQLTTGCGDWEPEFTYA